MISYVFREFRPLVLLAAIFFNRKLILAIILTNLIAFSTYIQANDNSSSSGDGYDSDRSTGSRFSDNDYERGTDFDHVLYNQAVMGSNDDFNCHAFTLMNYGLINTPHFVHPDDMFEIFNNQFELISEFEIDQNVYSSDNEVNHFFSRGSEGDAFAFWSNSPLHGMEISHTGVLSSYGGTKSQLWTVSKYGMGNLYATIPSATFNNYAENSFLTKMQIYRFNKTHSLRRPARHEQTHTCKPGSNKKHKRDPGDSFGGGLPGLGLPSIMNFY